MWYTNIDVHIYVQGLQRSNVNNNFYFPHVADGQITILLLYVDDIYFIGDYVKNINIIWAQLQGTYDVEDLGPLIHYLGLEYIRQPDGFILTRWGYATQILVDFGFEICNLAILPMIKNLHLIKNMDCFLVDAHFYQQMVGKLNFILQYQLEINFAMSNTNWFYKHLQMPHMDAIKHIYRYVKGTIDTGLFYRQGEDFFGPNFQMQIGPVTKMIGYQQLATFSF